MKYQVLTLFPEMFEGPLGYSILARAIVNSHITLDLHNIRDYAEGRHKVADDTPYGGGAGMVMKPEPIDRCLCHALHCTGPEDRDRESTRIILMSPQGSVFTQSKALELVGYNTLVLVCGHYEGVDERILDLWIDEELSIGDYVLTGGELAAMVVIDACSRMIPGGLGHDDSADQDSFMHGVLDYPHYTRPPEFRGIKVPEVLLSGHHGNIGKWRRLQSLLKTRKVRPDLFEKMELTKEDRRLLNSFDSEEQ
jgi:tRNA (guanine37-N1)-methyltransferase